jgi:hypothetical protein
MIAVSPTTYDVQLALIGSSHASTDLFTETWCEFDCLNAWAGPPSLTAPTGKTRFELRFENVDLAEADVCGVRVRLIAAIAGTAGGDLVHVDQRAIFAIDTPKCGWRSVLNDWVRPLQDLLILALGRPVRLTKLYLRPDGAAPRRGLAEASFQAIQAAPGPSPTQSRILSYNAPTLMTFEDSPLAFGDLLPRWFNLRSEMDDVFILLHAADYAPFMFSQHRYLSTFQSAEALARHHGLTREKTKHEHAARVESIISAARDAIVDDASVQWAHRVLKQRNDKPLSDQIRELVESTGEVGVSVLTASPDFGQAAAGWRAGVSHPGGGRARDPVERYWHGEVLRWIVRARILIDLGISPEEVARRVLGRAKFTHTVDQIRHGDTGGPQSLPSP